jgi:hypothetical protein
MRARCQQHGIHVRALRRCIGSYQPRLPYRVPDRPLDGAGVSQNIQTHRLPSWEWCSHQFAGKREVFVEPVTTASAIRILPIQNRVRCIYRGHFA